MLKKTITYEDFDGNQVTEDHFFHLSKADLVEMEVSQKGGMAAYLQTIIDSDDGNQIMAQFKSLILKSYGKRSDDGRRFTKNDQLRQEFESSEAYSTMFMELVTDAGAAAQFVEGVVPHNLENDPQLAKLRQANAALPPDPDAEEKPPRTWAETESAKMGEGELGVSAATPRRLTPTEVAEMDGDELKSLLATGRAVIG